MPISKVSSFYVKKVFCFLYYNFTTKMLFVFLTSVFLQQTLNNALEVAVPVCGCGCLLRFHILNYIIIMFKRMLKINHSFWILLRSCVEVQI